MNRGLACLVVSFPVLLPVASLAQSDPFSTPIPIPASPGAYQWGIEMLRFNEAWALTRGRAHIAFSDLGAIAPHEDLRTGFDGPLRPHLSQTLEPNTVRYHSTMTVGVAAARGGNGVGISGACPLCSVSLHDGQNERNGSLDDAVSQGAVAVNLSAGAATADADNPSCARGTVPAADCRVLERMEERDVVFVTIAGNNAANRVGFPANYPTAIGVGGLQPDGKFWTVGYEHFNPGSNYGPEIRLVAPSRDVLVPQPPGGVYVDPVERCGDRFDSTVGGFVSLPPSYSGYGDCNGTSFSAPWITALAGLMRSANPLLTAPEVRSILYSTATTPVPGPAGSGLTFHMPDAEAAVRAALGGAGITNRVTPMFSLFASATGHHLFTTSPQAAVAAAAGEFMLEKLRNPQTFTSFGDSVPGYPSFAGRICASAGNCITVPARRSFSVFTTEHTPLLGSTLSPLYRMSQVCTQGGGCATTRVFAYATSESGVHDLEQQGYALDVMEGYVYSGSDARPAGALMLCQAYDPQRIDHILYAAPQCDQSRLVNKAGETTGGNYGGNQFLGYVPANADVETNHTGLWWNPSESGWGVNFAQQGGVVFATLFTYDAAHAPMWLVMSGGIREPLPGPLGEDVYSGVLYRTTGPAFNANPFTPIPPSNLTAVGTMGVAFGAAGTTLTYTVNGSHVTKSIVPQVFGVAAAGCHGASDSRAGASNYQDLWWNPAESGWGINLTHQGNVIFATLFTYAADGKAMWLVMSDGVRQADGSFSGDLYRTQGPPFDANPFVPIGPTDLHRVGTMTLRFSDGEHAVLAYSIDGASVTKSIVRQVFGALPPACSG